jgi:hypothetical protein
MVGWTLDLFFGREIEQMITLRDVEMLSDRLARLRNKAKTDGEARLLDLGNDASAGPSPKPGPTRSGPSGSAGHSPEPGSRQGD